MGTFLGACLLLTVFSVFSVSSYLIPFCKLWRKFNLNEIQKSGDVVLGGLFGVHYTSSFPEQTFTSEPQQPSCKG